MQHLSSVPLDIGHIANIKERLTDLRNDFHALARLNDAQSRGCVMDPMLTARKSLFSGAGSDEFQIAVNSKLGKNVRVAGSPVLTAPYRGRYIPQNQGSLSRSLELTCIEPNVSEWFGLEFEADPNSLIAEKISNVYVFLKLLSDHPINVWTALFLKQGSHTTRIDLNTMYFDRNTHHVMLTKNITDIYDTSKEETFIRLGCYFPTSMEYTVNILDVRLLCIVLDEELQPRD